MNDLESLLVNGDWLIATDYLRAHGYSPDAIHLLMSALIEKSPAS
ncbi:hypothetical protein [Limosilactobacillus secaliphilus]|nr:hypothetical protein [Limosilactobacillus secaliphilus]